MDLLGRVSGSPVEQEESSVDGEPELGVVRSSSDRVVVEVSSPASQCWIVQGLVRCHLLQIFTTSWSLCCECWEALL